MSISTENTDSLSQPNAAANDTQNGLAPVLYGLVSTGSTAADLSLKALDDLKAEQMVTFDLRGRSNVCDFMIIASGRSNTHIRALVENLSKEFKKSKKDILSTAGTEQCDWVVFDANNVVVHIFRPEVRAFYQLEKMWDPSFQIAHENNGLHNTTTP